MKTTIKEIRNFWAKDVTDISNEDFQNIINEEQGLREVAWAQCIYGVAAMVWQGYRTGKLYKCTRRNTKIFIA